MLDTLANIKSHLGIAAGNTSKDAWLTEQGTLLTDTIEAYCRRKFLTADWIQTFYSDMNCPTRNMYLFHYPVPTIASITEDGVTLDPTQYRLNKIHGIVTRLNGNMFFNHCRWMQSQVIETVVTYTAGTGTAPTPILEVFHSLMAERYNKYTAGANLNFGSDVQRISIPGAISIDFDYTLNNNERKSHFGIILGNNLNVLDFYRSDRAVVGNDQLIYVEEN